MSNALAVAAVTSTLRFLLDTALPKMPGSVGSVAASTKHPHQVADSFKGVNIFLYQVTPNHAGSVTDLPARRADGSLAARPTTAVDLHYLFTFHGDDSDLEGQRLLAGTALALTTNPVLTRDLIRDAMLEYSGESTFLEEADLADQTELVKLAPAVLSLEELGRLWSALGNGYRLGLTYTATVVILQADVAARAALPVRARTVDVTPINRPRISEIAAPPGEPITVGTVVEVRGSGLLGPAVKARLGAVELPPEDKSRPDRLLVKITSDVPAGVRSLQVVHRAPATPVRVSARSNAAPLLVRPAVAVVPPDPNDPQPDEVALSVTPLLRPGQQAMVTLTRGAGDPVAKSFHLRPLRPDEPPSGTVTLARDEIPDGTWLVRISVDGAESMPVLAGGTYSEPALVLP